MLPCMTRRMIPYLRLSVAGYETSTSISRQEADLRAFAESNGWSVLPPLVDDGLSGRRTRANADEALRMIRDGEADVLAVWKLDRWTRQGLAAVGSLVTTLDAAPGSLFVALQDGLRSDQAAWRIIASVLAEVARMEAENTAARVRSSIRALKHSGRWQGGVPPLGYRAADAPDGVGRVLVVEPEEAAVLQRYAERLVAGEPLTRLARDLTAEGFPQARSPYRKAAARGEDPAGLDRGTWPVTTLRQVLRSETLVGRVSHHGEIVRGDDGRPIEFWPPAIPPALFASVRAALPPRGTKGPVRRQAARLLSGVIFCGDCGRKLHARKHSRGESLYRCPARVEGATCAVSSVVAERADEAVAEAYLSMVGRFPERVEIVTSAAEQSEAALAEIEEALRDLSTRLTGDDADPVVILAQMSDLKARRAEVRAAPAETRSEWRETGRTYREAWEASDSVDDRRRLLLTALDHVDLLPVDPADRGRRFSGSRLRYYWNS